MIRYRKLFTLGVFFILSYGYFNYFMERELGSTSPIVSFVKLLGLFLIFISCNYKKLKINGLSFYFLFFYTISLFSYLVAGALIGGFNDVLFLNTIVFLPFLFIKVDEEGVNFLLKTITVICGLQIMGDIYIYSTGLTLWTSNAFVGGMGNPSTYGLFLIISIVYVIENFRYSFLKIILVLYYYVSALFSFSLFISVISTCILIFYVSKNLKKKTHLRDSVILFVLLFLTYLYFAAEINAYLLIVFSFMLNKLNSLLYMVGIGHQVTYVSRSVGLRIDIFYQTIQGVQQSLMNFLFGHIYNSVYWFKDSQFLTYLGSFGVLIFLYFVLLNILFVYNTLQKKTRNNLGFRIIAYTLICMFFTNRILDYFPVAMIFLLLIKYFDPLANIKSKNMREFRTV